MPRTAARFIVIPPRVEPYLAYALEGDCLCASERLILSRADSSIGLQGPMAGAAPFGVVSAVNRRPTETSR